jgi:bifunctional DNA-binding transcriptional regulator/antitoxin component of YhaV-PrlF toxin-antitoxin module
MKKLKKRAVTVPQEILEKAGLGGGISLAAEVEDGAVRITAADPLVFVPEELKELFEELGISEETVRDVMMRNEEILRQMIMLWSEAVR